MNAIELTAEKNSETLRFISEFKDTHEKDLRSRWELWLQIELMKQLNSIKGSTGELYSEYRADYKLNKYKGAGRTAKGFVSGYLDIAYRPPGTDSGLLVGVELKVKRTAAGAIRGGLHDLLKPRAFVTDKWKFRAIYAACVFDSITSDESDSKYLKFVTDNDWPIIPLGNFFKVALIGWETKPRSGELKEFYAEYGQWIKTLLNKAKDYNLTINIKPA